MSKFKDYKTARGKSTINKTRRISFKLHNCFMRTVQTLVKKKKTQKLKTS